MATNTKQLTQCSDMAATTNRATRWNTGFEKKLAKLGQPALLQAFQLAVECSCDQFMRVDDLVENARLNPHKFTNASFPLNMPDIYAEFEQYDMEVCEDAEGNPEFLPTLEGYIAWLVVSKLWSLCNSTTICAGLVFTPTTVREITGVCLLAEHAQRICSSEDRAIAARRPLNLIWVKAGKAEKRQRTMFWKKAEKFLIDRYSSDRGLYPSLAAAAMTLSETGLYPYSFLECFQLLESFEEQM